MDYIGDKCPVCDKYFHYGDDIVVCPECGTPHHRECYTNNGDCINSDKHAEGYDYLHDKLHSSDIDDTIEFNTCKKCGSINKSTALFCSMCGTPFNENTTADSNPYQNAGANNTHSGQPFPVNQGPQVIMFDPLAGVNPSTDVGDGVTIGDVAKYVKTSTPYFVTVFNQIRMFAKSRFNFCAMFFGGGYLLYRKMYKIGSVITAIQAAMLILYYYLNYYITSSPVYDKLLKALYEYDTNATALYMSELSAEQYSMLMLYFAIAVVMLIMGIVIGACANRMYFNHCKKQIVKIKSEAKTQSECDTLYQKRGGVNMPLAISLWITYIILSYMPSFFY